MANTITLKRRMGSVTNTRQITKAMELVAASKMRRAQEHAKLGRVYREAAYTLLSRLSQTTEATEHPLFAKRPIKTKLYVVITSNRGLAGAYNANILRLLTRSIQADSQSKMGVQIIAVGKQAANYVRRVSGLELIAAYPAFGDHPTANDIRPLLNTMVGLYKDKKVDSVQLLYTEFRSNLSQIATGLPILPAQIPESDKANASDSALENVTFEPSIEAVLDNVTIRLLEVQLWQAMLESIASEHSMRMLAMKNATDNASDLIDDLTLEFNTARQAAITQELAEITGGAEVIK